MKALGVWTLALIAFLVLTVPDAARAGMTAADRVLTGELVVLHGARNQFRLVEHSGSFTAPARTDVAALDGKPVEVELGPDGRVVHIAELPIHIEPIPHSFEIISGELVLRDPIARTFAIAGDERTYVAPRGIDVGQYAGHLVEMRLDEQNQVMNINLNARSADAPALRSVPPCLFGDTGVASGMSICRGGRTFRCVAGEWVNLGTPCS
jgi:hypothetical protein